MLYYITLAIALIIIYGPKRWREKSLRAIGLLLMLLVALWLVHWITHYSTFAL